jgi:hypothetical protein
MLEVFKKQVCFVLSLCFLQCFHSRIVDVIMRDQEIIREKQMQGDRNTLYVLIIISDGCDTVNIDPVAKEAQFDRMSKMLNGSSCRVCVRTINIGKHVRASSDCPLYFSFNTNVVVVVVRPIPLWP